ncbi:hypothetical protein J6590_018135 [Homalodisca vitripennis]|nr:hypothetical protein J6590_018135 [Homalodisca vitripennis]
MSHRNPNSSQWRHAIPGKTKIQDNMVSPVRRNWLSLQREDYRDDQRLVKRVRETCTCSPQKSVLKACHGLAIRVMTRKFYRNAYNYICIIYRSYRM